ncbi:hypothetical protein [Enterococcus sp. AZ196]
MKTVIGSSRYCLYFSVNDNKENFLTVGIIQMRDGDGSDGEENDKG